MTMIHGPDLIHGCPLLKSHPVCGVDQAIGDKRLLGPPAQDQPPGAVYRLKRDSAMRVSRVPNPCRVEGPRTISRAFTCASTAPPAGGSPAGGRPATSSSKYDPGTLSDPRAGTPPLTTV